MVDEFEIVTLLPGETARVQERENHMPDRVRAFDQAGNLLFDRTYTWEDLEEAGWRVVITDDPPPTETAEQGAAAREGRNVS